MEFFHITLQCQFSVGKTMVQEQISICLFSVGMTRVWVRQKITDYIVQRRCFVCLTLILIEKLRHFSEVTGQVRTVSCPSSHLLCFPPCSASISRTPGKNSYGQVLELNCIFLECLCQGFFPQLPTFPNLF